MPILKVLFAFAVLTDILAFLIVRRRFKQLAADVAAAHARLDRIAPVTLADLGIEVVGCSACRVTPKNEKRPGCGNQGLAPQKTAKKAKPRKRTRFNTNSLR